MRFWILTNSSLSTGFFAWGDYVLACYVKGVVADMGRDLCRDYVCLGNFNTQYAEKLQIDSFDARVNEVAKTAVDMLTGRNLEHEVLIKPKLVFHSK